ncbi:MAG: hypothetical protein P4L53_03910 [Candidatus Obscuribacterales bacterium]|nr:hypothetical protein [Candidatus Obscuribacterales bacterium]
MSKRCIRRFSVDDHHNLKSAVLERVGDAIHFYPDLLALAAHYWQHNPDTFSSTNPE